MILVEVLFPDAWNGGKLYYFVLFDTEFSVSKIFLCLQEWTYHYDYTASRQIKKCKNFRDQLVLPWVTILK